MENTPDNPLQLEISIRVYQPQSYNSGLDLRQTLRLNSRNFMGLCGILAQFKELADRIEKGEKK